MGLKEWLVMGNRNQVISPLYKTIHNRSLETGVYGDTAHTHIIKLYYGTNPLKLFLSDLYRPNWRLYPHGDKYMNHG